MERTRATGTKPTLTLCARWQFQSSRCWSGSMWLKHSPRCSLSTAHPTTSASSLCRGWSRERRNWLSTLFCCFGLDFTSSHPLRLSDTLWLQSSLVASLCVSIQFASATRMKLIEFQYFVGFNLYCFMCVYSLFALMRDAEEYQRLTGGPQRQPPPNYGNAGTTYVKIWVYLLPTTWLISCNRNLINLWRESFGN